MNKAYILFPLIGLLIFGGYYLHFSKEYEAKKVALQKLVEEQRKERLRKDQEARVEAIRIANQQTAERKAIREAKDKKEKEEQRIREEAQDRRSRLFDDVTKRLRPQVDRLKKEVEQIKEVIARLELEKKNRTDEVKFLHEYVQKAEANKKSLFDLLEKLAAIEKARADAAAAAAKVH